MRFTSVYKPRNRSGRDDPWLIAVTIPGGRRRYVTGTRSRSDSERLADRLAGIAERIAAGLEQPAALDAFLAARVTLAQSLKDYHDWLYSVGRTHKHADQMYDYCTKMLAGVDTVYHLTGPALQAKVAAVTGSSNTRKRYFDAVKSFLSWGWKDRRWGREPLDAIAAVAFRGQRERRRRVLSLEELAALIRTSGSMATVYTVTLLCGLRAGELPYVQIAGTHVKIDAKHTKNRRGAWIRLPEHVAASARLVEWHRLQPANLARRLRRDLTEAGIEFETPEGVFDFHALRHQCGALLAISGLSPKAIQAHMRHASIRMTLDTYGHLLDADRRATAMAVENICQRVAQQTEQGSDLCGTAARKQLPAPPNIKWSDGESNPDLLNAIQPADLLMYLVGHELRDKRNRSVARGAAVRLLARLAGRQGVA